MEDLMNTYLTDIFYNPAHPASYGGVRKLHSQAKRDGKNYSLKDISKWLEAQDSYTLFKKVKQTFKRPRVVVSFKKYQFDSDTANMVKWRKHNKGYSYFLVVIDIFTRFAWTYPLQTLTGKETVEGLRKVFKREKCSILRTDGGSEFNNKWVKQLLQKENVKHVVTRNVTKANFAERLIKSLKRKIIKHMYHNQTQEWVKSLEMITKSYNNTYHRSIKTSPSEAWNLDKVTLWQRQFDPVAPKKRDVNNSEVKKTKEKKLFKFNEGDIVRLAHFKEPFTREYDENWTHELFKIVDKTAQQGIPQYTVKGWDNEPVDGRFYNNQLEKVQVDENTTYMIEKLLQKKTINGKPGFIVRWLGWPERFDSWVSKSDLKEIKQIQ